MLYSLQTAKGRTTCISVFHKDNETSQKRSFNTYNKELEDTEQMTKFLLPLVACLVMVTELRTDCVAAGYYTGVIFITNQR
jgi:hypothetical protein